MGKSEKEFQEIIFDKDIQVKLEEIALADFRNFKLSVLAEKIKSQACIRPRSKMLYY